MIWKFPAYEIDKPIDWDLIESKFTWFRDMKDVPQNPDWHAEGDVFTHTKMVVEGLVSMPEYKKLIEQDKHILFTAALMHDVEKRSTTITEKLDGVERISSPKHAKKGELTARSVLYKDIVTPFPVREKICKLIRLHGLPIWAIEKSNPRREIIYSSLLVNTKHLSLLAKADALGRICNDQEELLLKIELFNELCRENKCFGTSRKFETDYARYLFLNKSEASPDYVPFDDLKFDVILMCALPGGGKDTYIERNLNLPILSLDDIRREHKIAPTDKKKNGQVIQMGKERAKEFMRSKTSFVFNATNITSEMRNKWISLFTDYGGRVKIIYIEVPYNKLLAQNNNREYKVPEDVIEKMIDKLEIPTPNEAHEIEFMINNKT